MVWLTQICATALAASTLATAARWPFTFPGGYGEPPQYTSISSSTAHSTLSTVKTPSSSGSKSTSAVSVKSSISVNTIAQSSGLASSRGVVQSSGTASSRGFVQSSGSASSLVKVSSGTVGSSAKSSASFKTSSAANTASSATGVGSSAKASSARASASSPVSSRVPSSSATSSVNTASSASSGSIISVSGCPPITVTTSTSVVIPTVFTSTSTLHYPPYVYNVSTGTFVSTTTIYGTIVTAYSQTTTYTDIVVSSPTATVTVPTSPGFTPVSCEATYYDQTTTITNGNYYTDATIAITDSALPVSTLGSYTVTYNSTFTTSVPTGTITTISTSTITETRSDLTTTSYDACATNNVASMGPGGGYFFYTGGTKEASLTAIDAVDCCELCQADSSCVGSVFISRYVGDFSIGPLPQGAQNCVLWGRIDGEQGVCNASYVAPIAEGGEADGPYVTISNSGCGQYDVV